MAQAAIRHTSQATIITIIMPFRRPVTITITM